jgi:predicted phosphodiesterase
MAKIGFTSDAHTYTGNIDETNLNRENLDSILSFLSKKKINKIADCGDILNTHVLVKNILTSEEFNAYEMTLNIVGLPENMLEELSKKNNIKLEELISSVNQNQQALYGKIVKHAKLCYEDNKNLYSKNSMSVERVKGNHDFDFMENIFGDELSYNTDFGKYFFQTNPPGLFPTGLEAKTHSDDYKNHMENEKPTFALFHAYPENEITKKQSFPEGSSQANNAKWVKNLSSKIILYGHQHFSDGYQINYDKKTKKLELGVNTEKGYFAEIDYNEKTGTANEVVIYRIPKENNYQESA